MQSAQLQHTSKQSQQHKRARRLAAQPASASCAPWAWTSLEHCAQHVTCRGAHRQQGLHVRTTLAVSCGVGVTRNAQCLHVCMRKRSSTHTICTLATSMSYLYVVTAACTPTSKPCDRQLGSLHIDKHAQHDLQWSTQATSSVLRLLSASGVQETVRWLHEELAGGTAGRASARQLLVAVCINALLHDTTPARTPH